MKGWVPLTEYLLLIFPFFVSKFHVSHYKPFPLQLKLFMLTTFDTKLETNLYLQLN